MEIRKGMGKGVGNFGIDLKNSEAAVKLVEERLHEIWTRGPFPLVFEDNHDYRWDFIARTADKKHHIKVEVKNDTIFDTSGNLAIEVECRGVSSGLSVSLASVYAFVTEHKIFFCYSNDLKKMIADEPRLNFKYIGDDNASKCYLICERYLIEHVKTNIIFA